MPQKLDDAFQVTIDRINRQSVEKSNKGREVLKWTFLAFRQLTIPELRHALATINATTDSESLNPDALPFEKSLIDCCHGLVVIDKQTSSIRLVHKSLQDFLKKQHKENKLFETGHRDMARICLEYLNLSDSTITDESDKDITSNVESIAWCSLDNEVREEYAFTLLDAPRIKKYPFLRYAIHYWGRHAKMDIGDDVTKLAVEIMCAYDSAHKISRGLLMFALGGVYMGRGAIYELGFEVGDIHSSGMHGFCGLHLSAYFGLDRIANALIDAISDINIDEGLWIEETTPLVIAAEEGHESIIHLLRDKGGLEDSGFDTDAKNRRGITALQCAAKRGNESIVCLLLDNFYFDLEEEDYYFERTALAWAVVEGYEGIVGLLIGHSAYINTLDGIGKTPLDNAIQYGSDSIQDLLRSNGAKRGDELSSSESSDQGDGMDVGSTSECDEMLDTAV
jgi:hypothetical protein